MRFNQLKNKARLAASFCIVACLFASFAGFQAVSAQENTPDKNIYEQKSTYLSPVKESKIPFTGLAMKWKQYVPESTSVIIYIKFLTRDGWTEWVKVEGDFDDPSGFDSSNPEDFISTNLATAYQYKVELESQNPDITPVIENLEFTFIHARAVYENPDKVEASLDTTKSSFMSMVGDNMVSLMGGLNLNIISRSGWGADESLRIYNETRPEADVVEMEDGFEKEFSSELTISSEITADSSGKTLTWPLEYPEKVSKIIIHHTATTKDLNDPKQAIRNIYYYHAISRGWGDIGYNYIIDQNGNIYEGRYGGDGVVGGHAAKYNIGSIGIAVLGNFQENEVPQPVIDSLSNLIKVKSAKHGIDPEGTSMFRGKLLPNVLGHRDVGATACPGQKLYDILPAIKKMAKGALIANIIDKRRLVSQSPAYDFDLDGALSFIQLDAGVQKNIQITLKNTGTAAWDANTYLMLSNNNSWEYLLNGYQAKTNTAGKQIAPGSNVTFTLPLQASHKSGFSNLEIFPMINGSNKIEKYISVPMQVIGANYDYELVELTYNTQFLRRGQVATATLKLRNTGTIKWERDGENKVRLGTENPRDRISRVIVNPGTRLAELKQESVAPGETGEFEIQIKAPNREGYFREYFSPVIEGVTWLENKGLYFEFYVSDTDYSGTYLGTSNLGSFLPGEKKPVWFELMNIGRRSWFKEGTSVFKLDYEKSANLDVTDIQMQDDKVLPGETVKVNMFIKAPPEEGLYRIIMTPKVNDTMLVPRPIVLYIKVSKNGISETNWLAQRTVSPYGSDNIRVGLGFRGDPVISADGYFKLYNGDSELATFNPDEKVTVTYEQGKFQIKGYKSAFALSEPPIFTPVDNSILRIDNYENRPAWKPELNDNEYQGNLEVYFYENQLQVVNELPLEDYLKGLAEISATEHYEKIKAVIVLARSYAKYYMTKAEKFPGAPYNLTDDAARSQKYLGYGFTKRNITGGKAVESTKGQVVTYNSELIKTPYFSSSDGRTRSAEEVWGWTDTPYLQSVDDPGCAGQTLNGHGVGLSGCGAQYFAQQGKNYREIIQYYFKGVEIVQM